MNKFWTWLVTSSEDPSKLALTVKGGLGLIVTVVLALSPLFHLTIGSDQLNAIADAIVQAVVVAAGLVSAVATIAGLVRKLKSVPPPADPTPLPPSNSVT